jgi:hypothetical protein
VRALVLVLLASCAPVGSTGETETDPAAVTAGRREVLDILERLDAYYASPDGLSRPNGLSLGGRPDFEGVAAWVLDVYLASRESDLSVDASWQNVVASIQRTEEWQVKHPGVAPAPFGGSYRPLVVLDRRELLDVMQRLDDFYASDMGLGRPDGLSIGGRPDFEGVAAWVLDVYLAARRTGAHPTEAWDRVVAEIERSDEWRGRHPPADPSTLYGKHLMGYQGWFAAPGDGIHGAWGHWFAGDPVPERATFDAWPDMREYTPGELFPTAMTMPDGSRASLFSSQNARTVDRHFRWMREAGVDGVSLGRFSAGTSGATLVELDRVLANVRAAAEQNERVFFVWYDVTGHDPSRFAGELRRDWEHLVNDTRLLESRAYLHHRGRPLVGVWGIGAGDRPGTPDEWASIIDWFKNHPDPRYRATILAGGIANWRDDPTWSPIFARADVVSPWAVGAFGDDAGADHYRRTVLEPDIAACDRLGIDYLPIAFPGFSWHNLQRGASPVNAVPRRGGRFYWRQVHNIVDAGGRVLFTAMFDEVDEGTAMLKIAPTAAEAPAQGSWLTLDADGEQLSSDFYLRLGGAAGRMLRGEIPRTTSVPIPP